MKSDLSRLGFTGLIVRNGAYNALEQNLVKDALREYMMVSLPLLVKLILQSF